MNANQLSRSVVVASLALTLAIRAGAQDPTAHAMAGQASDHIALVLDGESEEYMRSLAATGGNAPITLTLAPGGSTSPFGQWMAGAINGNGVGKNGSIVTADYQYRPKTGLSFNNATLSEITFPELSGSNKSPYVISAIITPATSTFTTFPSNAARLSPPLHASRTVTSENYRLAVKGMEGASQHVTKIDALTIRPGGACPVLAVTVPAAFAGPFIQASQSVGEKRREQRWSGYLDVLDITGSTVLYQFAFEGLQIAKLEEKASAANHTYRAEFSCEKVELK